MSVEALAWALATPLGGSSKLVLIGLANHARADGSQAWPAVETLAQYAAVDRRTVQRCLRRLEADDWIVKSADATSNRPAVYQLRMGRQIAAPTAEEGRHSDAPGAAPVSRRGDTTVLVGAAWVSPEPSITVNEPSLHAAARASATVAGGEVTEPITGESVDELVAWLDHQADHFGGAFGAALAVSEAELRSVLAAEKPEVRLEVVRWLAAEAPSWSASTLASALSRSGAVLKRARRDAAKQRPMQAPVVVLEQSEAALQVAEELMPRLLAQVELLSPSIVDLWVWPLAVVAPSGGALVVLGGAEHQVGWSRDRLSKLFAQVAAPRRLEWRSGDVSGLVTLGDLAAEHGQEATA